MKFRIVCVHSSHPNAEPQLFAEIKLPDNIQVNGCWSECINDGLSDEILSALNAANIRDCVFSFDKPNNHSEAMQKYWKRRKLSELNCNNLT